METLSLWTTMIFVFLHLATLSDTAGCELFKLQAEAFKTEGRIIRNAKASGMKAVHLNVGQRHNMFFCLQRETQVALHQIRYLNEGKSKSLVVHIDGTYVDVVNAHNKSSCAKLNQNYSTQKGFGDHITLARGRHILRFKVTSGDQHGIDLDLVVLNIKDSDLNWDTFRCRSFCNSEIPFVPSVDATIKDTTSPAKAVQKSYRTQCAEVDNVKIFLFHENVRRYKLRARHPVYHTLANKREPDFNRCSFSTNLLWQVKDITFFENTLETYNKTVTIRTEKKNKNVVDLTATFRLQGREAGKNDPDVGDRLTVDVENVPTRVAVKAVVLGRNGEWTSIGQRNAKRGTNQLQWTIPDYTWVKDGESKLKLTFTGININRVKIASAKLEKRWLKADKSFQIFNDANMILEGVNIDMWWLKDNITITIEGEDRTWNAHYFRFYFPVPWSDGFSQVFVMYQDGNVRLLPCSPHGADWIPFGSSVIVGQVNSSDLRPFAEIKRVHITPYSQEITVFYVDGGVVLITLEITMDETIAHVKVLRLGRDPTKFPFVSFRSMWVKDGNSDVDHVSANGLHSRHILDDWGSLFGYSFTFYRQCISVHNTQSPDINIEIVE